MIVSFLHNFIFIKTRKTAGTTAELVLAPHCGPDDIITPLGNDEERLRGNGRPLCRNFTEDPEWEDRFSRLIVGGRSRDREEMVETSSPWKFRNHMGASEIKERVAPEFWDKAVKITTMRHPYEKAVSLAFFTFKPRRTDAPWEEHLDQIVRRGGYASDKHYAIDGKVIIDEFIKQERLLEDFKRIGARLGIRIPDELPRSKIKTRQDSRSAREILTDEHKMIIYTVCREEFDLLGYER